LVEGVKNAFHIEFGGFCQSREKSATNWSGDKTPFVKGMNAIKRVVSKHHPDATFGVMNGRELNIKHKGKRCEAYCENLTRGEVQAAAEELRERVDEKAAAGRTCFVLCIGGNNADKYASTVSCPVLKASATPRFWSPRT
jgi:hypothetical protein